MNCNNCGTTNNLGSNFCIKCGNPLQNQQVANPNVVEQPVEQSVQSSQSPQFQEQQVAQPIQQVVEQHIQAAQAVNGFTQPVQPQVQSMQQPVMVNSPKYGNVQPLNFFMYLVAILLKPFQTFKEEESKLCIPKNSIILTLIVSGAMMLINLVKTIFNVVMVKTFDYSKFDYKSTWQWENVKNLDWFSLIGKNLLIYAGIIAAIAVVYYLASLVVKKNIDFFKMLSISASSIIPFVLLGMIVSPLASKLWNILGVVFIILGIIYSLLILIDFVNECVKFDKKDNRIYFNLTCISLLLSIGYYILMKTTYLAFFSGLSDYTSLFG